MSNDPFFDSSRDKIFGSSEDSHNQANAQNLQKKVTILIAMLILFIALFAVMLFQNIILTEARDLCLLELELSEKGELMHDMAPDQANCKARTDEEKIEPQSSVATPSPAEHRDARSRYCAALDLMRILGLATTSREMKHPIKNSPSVSRSSDSSAQGGRMRSSIGRPPELLVIIRDERRQISSGF